MPIHRVTRKGQRFWQWGGHGALYRTREGAVKQAGAAYAHGYKRRERLLEALHRVIVKERAARLAYSRVQNDANAERVFRLQARRAEIEQRIKEG